MLLVKEKLNHESIIQYKIEERSIVSRRLINSGNRVEFLVNIMKDEVLSTPENLENLKNEIFIFTQDDSFKKANQWARLCKLLLTICDSIIKMSVWEICSNKTDPHHSRPHPNHPQREDHPHVVLC